MEGRREWNFAVLVALAHLAVTTFAVTEHEMWRDELHCWLVARDSPTPWDLIQARAYDGQQPLWYLLLWPLTRATWHPEAMRVAHSIIAAANVLLFARFAPFTRVARVLFAFGYFVAYEYAALSRCYGLGFLFALLLCCNHPRRFAHPVVTGLLIAALALTTTVGTLVAAGYAAALLVDWVVAAWHGPPGPRSAWIPIGFAAAAAVAATLCAWPPPDSTVAHIGRPPDMPTDFAPTRVLAALIPVPRADFFFWNSNALLTWVPFASARILLALSLVVWVLYVLSCERFAWVLFGVGTSLLVALFAGVYSGSVRHAGFVFVLFVMAAWIASSARGGPRAPERSRWGRLRRRGLAPTVMIVLLAQIPGTAIAIAYDARYVFSSGRRAADVLRTRGLADIPIVAEIDYAATAMLGQLGPHAIAYSPRTGRPFSFVRWTPDRLWDPTDQQTLQYATAFGATRREDPVLVMNRPLLPELVDGVNVVRIAELYDSMIEEENFYLYRVRRPAER
jgi:hypothetical protein